jgi:hypothetical protein
MTPTRPRDHTAISRVSVTSSARIVVSAVQPTIIRENTSMTDAT